MCRLPVDKKMGRLNEVCKKLEMCSGEGILMEKWKMGRGMLNTSTNMETAEDKAGHDCHDLHVANDEVWQEQMTSPITTPMPSFLQS